MLFFKTEKPVLNYILFEVTQNCNLHCTFCYNHWKADDKAKKPELSFNETQKTLNKLFSKNQIKHVTFTGGEPLLCSRLEELVLFCRMKGATVSLITNGNAGTPQLFSSLIKTGVKLFELPLHAPDAATHDRMTGVIGSWEKSLASIRYLTKMGAYVVPVIVITKNNYSKIEETLTYLHNLNLRRIMINRYNIGGFGVHNREKVVPTITELNEAFRQAALTAKKLNLEISSNVCTPHCVVNPKQYVPIAFTNCSMEIEKRPITLTAHGEVRFCNHSPSVMGNIHVKPISEIFKNYTKQNPIYQPEFCSNCEKYNTCLGGCRAAAEQVGKTFNDVDPLVELISKNENTQTA